MISKLLMQIDELASKVHASVSEVHPNDLAHKAHLYGFVRGLEAAEDMVADWRGMTTIPAYQRLGYLRRIHDGCELTDAEVAELEEANDRAIAAIESPELDVDYDADDLAEARREVRAMEPYRPFIVHSNSSKEFSAEDFYSEQSEMRL